MSSFIRPLALLSLLGTTASFQALTTTTTTTSTTALNGASYLDHLGGGIASQQQLAGAAIPAYLETLKSSESATGAVGAILPSYLDTLAPYSTDTPPAALVAAPIAAAGAAPVAPASASSIVPIGGSVTEAGGNFAFPYAPIEQFAIKELEFKGARTTADWGTPEDATRALASDGELRAGSWWCAQGGWPSPSPKAHTEIFFVLSGHGKLDDADGTQHYFGPGDTVIIPKGHTGRWDVNTNMHKIWAVNAHAKIEDKNKVIRVQVDGYHSFAPQYLTENRGFDFLYYSPNPNIASKCFYDVGPTKVGVWSCTPSSFPVTGGPRSFFHMLEGVVVVTDGATGEARRCAAGDTVMLPAGWSGTVDVLETCKKLWTTAD